MWDQHRKADRGWIRFCDPESHHVIGLYAPDLHDDDISDAPPIPARRGASELTLDFLALPSIANWTACTTTRATLIS